MSHGGRLYPVKQSNNRRGLLHWLNLRGIGGLKTGKDQDDKPNGGLCPIYAPRSAPVSEPSFGAKCKSDDGRGSVLFLFFRRQNLEHHLIVVQVHVDLALSQLQFHSLNEPRCCDSENLPI